MKWYPTIGGHTKVGFQSINYQSFMKSDSPAPEYLSTSPLDDNQELELLDFDGEINKHVEVTSVILDGRKRRISAKTHIPFDIEQIWQILTDYDTLADFIPSLKESRRIEHPQNGIRIEQIGSQSLLKVNFCAKVVLDMFESFPNRIEFEMIEGDFSEFHGSWNLSSVEVNSTLGTSLEYIVDILPKRFVPINLIEKKLKYNLTLNLLSINQQAIRLFT